MGAFRIERNHGPCPEPGTVLLARQARARGGLCTCPRRKKPVALECEWSANNFDPKNLIAFRHQHPEGDNLVIAHDVNRAFSRSYGDLRVRFDGLRSFADLLSS